MNYKFIIGRTGNYFSIIIVSLSLDIISLVFALRVDNPYLRVLFWLPVVLFSVVVLAGTACAVTEFSRRPRGYKETATSFVSLAHWLTLYIFVCCVAELSVMKYKLAANNIYIFTAAAAMMTLSLFSLYRKHYKWVFKEETFFYFSGLPFPNIKGLRFAVIADAHLGFTGSYERGVPLNVATESLTSKLLEVKEQCDYILFLGDITDTGRREEWQAFNSILKRPELHKKVILVPGNHDITFDSDYTTPRQRVKNFISLAACKYCHNNSVLGSNRTVGEICGVTEAKRAIEEIFPMIMLETDTHLVIGLNSATEHGIDMITNGMGRLSDLALERLEHLFSDKYKNKILVIALHHHVGFASHDFDELSRDTVRLRLKGLKLKNAHDFLQLIERLRHHFAFITILHGHLHRKFANYYKNVSIISVSGFEDSAEIPIITT